jgi:hypothetical protein
MPKNNKKGRRQRFTATAENDGDFDDMLAELRSENLTALTANRSSSSSGSSINPNISTGATIKNVFSTATSAANAYEIPEERIIEAVKRGNIGQLRRWARQGIRISSGVPLFHAVVKSRMDVVQCLVKELGADVNKPDDRGRTPLCITAQMGDLAIMRALVKDLHADVNKTDQAGYSPLWIAARVGDLAIVQCLVKELGADVDLAGEEGTTPLMVASVLKHTDIVKWLIKAGANAQAAMVGCHNDFTGTALDFSKILGASSAQTAYLEAKTHCSSQGCSGAGLLKCTGCRQARYCGESCQLSHWKAHKADCRRWSTELEASKGSSGN